jgi:hypothetical protein
MNLGLYQENILLRPDASRVLDGFQSSGKAPTGLLTYCREKLEKQPGGGDSN